MKPYDKRCDKCKHKGACRFKFAVTDGWTFCEDKDAFEPI